MPERRVRTAKRAASRGFMFVSMLRHVALAVAGRSGTLGGVRAYRGLCLHSVSCATIRRRAAPVADVAKRFHPVQGLGACRYVDPASIDADPYGFAYFECDPT